MKRGNIIDYRLTEDREIKRGIVLEFYSSIIDNESGNEICPVEFLYVYSLKEGIRNVVFYEEIIRKVW